MVGTLDFRPRPRPDLKTSADPPTAYSPMMTTVREEKNMQPAWNTLVQMTAFKPPIVV